MYVHVHPCVHVFYIQYMHVLCCYVCMLVYMHACVHVCMFVHACVTPACPCVNQLLQARLFLSTAISPPPH